MQNQARKALVTGSSRGIGRATAIRLAKNGFDVVVNYVTSEAAAQATAEEVMKIGRQALVVKADMGEPEDIQAMIQFISETWGGLDVLVSNAASGGFRMLDQATIKHFDAAMHTNVRALMLLVQGAKPLLEQSFAKQKKMAKVVAITSHGSYRALPAYSLIGAAKAAIESLMRHFALEFGPLGINFNCVLAGLVKTDSTAHVPDADRMFASMNDKLLLPTGITLEPECVAEAIAFLASPQSDLIQGQTLIMDGGAALTV